MADHRPHAEEFAKVVHTRRQNEERSNMRQKASFSDEYVPVVLKRCSPDVWETVGVVGSCGADVEDNGDAVACIGASKYKQYGGNGCTQSK
jgi:hypothetical protein